MNGSAINFTKGSVPKQLFWFSMPIFLSNLLQSVYNMADMAVVGHVVGSSGVAAISNASMLCFIINAVGMGITTGGTVLIAQYKGAQDTKGQQDTTGALFALTAVTGVLVTLLSLCIYRAVFAAMRVPEGAMEDACAYMNILCWGTVFIFGYNAVCAVLRGLGDAKRPLSFVAVAAALNVVLDLLFVGPLGLGTRGAALATVISQGVSFFLSLFVLRYKQAGVNFRQLRFALPPGLCRRILGIGLPSAVQMAVTNLSFLLITAMLNVYGVTIAAAAGIGLKISTFAVVPCWAIGQALTTMAGQNMGAGKIARVKQVVKYGACLNILVTVLVVAFVQLFAAQMVTLFAPSDPAVLQEGVHYLRICCSFGCVFYAAMYSFDSFATGVGAAFLAMGNSILDAVVFKVLFSWLAGFVLGYGEDGVYLGQALAAVLPALIGAGYYFWGKWGNRRLI